MIQNPQNRDDLTKRQDVAVTQTASTPSLSKSNHCAGKCPCKDTQQYHDDVSQWYVTSVEADNKNAPQDLPSVVTALSHPLRFSHVQTFIHRSDSDRGE